MPILCEYCGNQPIPFLREPLILGDGKVLCHHCSALIDTEMNALPLAKTREEFEALRDAVIAKCETNFNEEITALVADDMNKLYATMDFTANRTAAPQRPRVTAEATPPIYNQTKTDMFNNIGGKLKLLAKIVTVIGIVFSIIYGCLLMESSIFVGFLYILLGSLIAYVSSFALYGFGQLIENSDEILKTLKKEK